MSKKKKKDDNKQKFYNGTSDRVFKTIANSGEEGKKFLEAILKLNYL